MEYQKEKYIVNNLDFQTLGKTDFDMGQVSLILCIIS